MFSGAIGMGPSFGFLLDEQGDVRVVGTPPFPVQTKKGNAIGFSDSMGQIRNIAVGPTYALIATARGEVFSYGIGRGGQLGQGPDIHHTETPKKIDFFNGKRIATIHASEGCSFVSVKAPEVGLYGFGRNGVGELGIGTSGSDIFLPTLTVGIQGVVVQVLTSRTEESLVDRWGATTIVRTHDGAVFFAGFPAFNVTGDGAPVQVFTPFLEGEAAVQHIAFCGQGINRGLTILQEGKVCVLGDRFREGKKRVIERTPPFIRQVEVTSFGLLMVTQDDQVYTHLGNQDKEEDPALLSSIEDKVLGMASNKTCCIVVATHRNTYSMGTLGREEAHVSGDASETLTTIPLGFRLKQYRGYWDAQWSNRTIQPRFLSELTTTLGIPPDADIVKATQEQWLRRPGQERWEMTELPKHRMYVLDWGTQQGLFDAWEPKNPSYDQALILGATTSRMQMRLDFLNELWNTGIRFQDIVWLTGDRPLDPKIDGLTDRCKNESEAARILWEEALLSPEMRSRTVTFIAVPMKQEGSGLKRPTTEDTLVAWLQRFPNPCSALFISNQPFCGHQFAVVRSIVPKEYPVDLAGSGVDPNSHPSAAAITLDSIARLLFQEKKGR